MPVRIPVHWANQPMRVSFQVFSQVSRGHFGANQPNMGGSESASNGLIDDTLSSHLRSTITKD